MHTITFPTGSSDVDWVQKFFDVVKSTTIIEDGYLTSIYRGPVFIDKLYVHGIDLAFTAGRLTGGMIDRLELEVIEQMAITIAFEPPLTAAVFQAFIDDVRAAETATAFLPLALALFAAEGTLAIEAHSATQFDALSLDPGSAVGDGMDVVLGGGAGNGTATGTWAGIEISAFFTEQEALIGTHGADTFRVTVGFSNTIHAQRGFTDARGNGLLFAWTGSEGTDSFDGSGAGAGLILIDYAAEAALHPTHATAVSVNLSGGTIGSLASGKARDTFGDIDTVTGLTSFRLTTAADMLTAGGAAVYVAAGAGADRLTGSAAADELLGEAGNDVLDGRVGADRLIGGTGNDTYFADTSSDRIEEAVGGGFDVVNYSGTGTYVLGTNLEKLNLVGTTALNATGNTLANTISGNNLANTLSGMSGADTMSGGLRNDLYIADMVTDRVIEGTGSAAGIDTVRFTGRSGLFALGANVENLVLYGTAATAGKGNGSANIMIGNAASNALDGGLGKDILTGGGGRDFFVFSTKLSTANIDRIADFRVADDGFRLDNAVFTKIGAGKGLVSQQFWKSADGKAHDTTDRILYETDTGKLFYDPDGTGAGKAIQFALLSKGLLLTHADFLII